MQEKRSWPFLWYLFQVYDLGETLTMVAWLTMVNHNWTMVDSGSLCFNQGEDHAFYHGRPNHGQPWLTVVGHA